MSANREQVSGAASALTAFDDEWPRFQSLRNLEEHILGPGSDQPPYGIWYFGDAVADLGPGGSVEFLFRVQETQQSVRTLAAALENVLSSDLALIVGG